ncbi:MULTISPECIES: ornithine cyclodeaminase family protein [unclassified Staphylococcus]|uniref:ornithine cyclodeaminase family protein n=1 Tax=unclassified Staphylococcus TaxID=91994 RepID=UPI0021CFCC47|nr:MULTISPECIES: ornithine cyclodeaminase family protein [unclassified Staphylococcus]UXR79136.1 ornithine cyclodeaminase family protein [Staphylococcus sp. IVB6227]UXR81767.1 ornithine cyclodeaminase family protein [Staphylococcus sp. IVB6214]
MKVFTEKEVMATYQMSDAIQDIENLFQNMDDVSQTSRVVIPTGEGAKSMLYMPCIHFGKQQGIVKITSITPENPQHHRPTTQANIVITDLTTGEHVASMDGSYLTRLRTGALSGIATKYMSRPDSKILGMIGTGGMAYEQLLGNLEVRPIEKVLLFNRSSEKAHAFKARIADKHPNVIFEVVSTVDELVKQSDIINCQTQSTSPVFNANDVQPGTHINGIGSYRPEMKEMDNRLFPASSQIVFDDLEGVKEEAGEFIEADKQGLFSFDQHNDDLKGVSLNGKVARNDEDITIFKCVGAAHFDLAVALGAWEKFNKNNG